MSPINMQRLESGIRCAAGLFGCIDSHDVAGILRILGEDCVLESATPAPDGDVISGKEDIRWYFETLFAERNGIRYRIEEMTGFGHRCLVRYRCTWTDGTGKVAAMRGVDIIEESDCLIREILRYGKCKPEDRG